MNIPMSWIKDYVDIDVDINTFMDAMTMSGSKVESLERKGEEICNVVVGKIVKIDSHPDAERLVVTQVDIGKEDLLQIVTAAKNIFEGALVPVALNGAILNGGLKIKKSKLRGVESNGMFCSIEELGYTTNDYPEAPQDGIYIFRDEQELGSDVCKILEVKEDIVEFEITSNRADCFSIVGLAREASVTFNKEFKYPQIKVEGVLKEDIKNYLSVDIENKDLCNRYVARVVKNVKIENSPQWLRHRLITSGIKPVNNIVDITNYVLLELGQPMHAFDINNISNGNIIVKNATNGENFKTLDGIERTLNSSMLVIADDEKTLAIAGVMGGENSMITNNTKTIVLESANFDGTNVRLTSKKLGLRTDSSSKFEKNLDPNICLDAVNRACQLIETLGYGEVVDTFIDVYENKLDVHTVEYDPDKINKLLGTNISAQEMEDILNRLEIKSKNNIATVPTFRQDIECGADIAEEVIRIYGYDKIESTLHSNTATVGKRTYNQTIEDIIKNTLVSIGFSEIMTYSFESPKVFDKLNIEENSNLRNAIKIINPLGEDFSIMRTTTVNGMLQSLNLNYSKRNNEVLLFELSRVYIADTLPIDKLPKEDLILTLGLYSNDKEKDFYYIKGVVEELLNILGLNKDIDYKFKTDCGFMHPGRTAQIDIKNIILGFLGQVHPVVVENYSIPENSFIATINVTKLFDLVNLDKKYKPLPKFPESSRDIAMIVDESIMVKEIEDIIVKNAGKILESLKVFDVYKGNQIGKGYKSVAFNLTFRSSERTLTDEEVNASMTKIISKLETELNAKLRS